MALLPGTIDLGKFRVVYEEERRRSPDTADGYFLQQRAIIRLNPGDRINLYGLYTGIPLTERGTDYAGVLPDRIEIYRPLLADPKLARRQRVSRKR